MKVDPIKTHKITPELDSSLTAILDRYIPALEEHSIVVIASKIVAICEGRVASANADKEELIKKEADFYLDEPNTYNIMLAIKDNILIASAGIDESNADNNYILWPLDAQKSANRTRDHLKKKFALTNLGVIIADSRTTILRWGTTGVGIAYAGFKPLRDYIGKKDIFGRPLQHTQASILDGLASAAVVVMGEGSEQTPLALITELKETVEFVDHNPTPEELRSIAIDKESDIYAPLLRSATWKRGEGK